MDKLKFIAEQMKKLSIPYAFGEWKAKIQYSYWVGEYTEETTITEDGYEESVFLLTGTHRGTWLQLEEEKNKIKDHFTTTGLRAKTDSGSIVVFFSSAQIIPTGEADLKRIQINLDIKEWKGTE